MFKYHALTQNVFSVLNSPTGYEITQITKINTKKENNKSRGVELGVTYRHLNFVNIILKKHSQMMSTKMGLKLTLCQRLHTPPPPRLMSTSNNNILIHICGNMLTA